MFQRPDGRTFTRHPADVDDNRDVYASVQEDLSAWIAAGFTEHRREQRYVVPTTTGADGDPPSGYRFERADDVVEDRLRQLDNVLRQDVPGTDGWRWEPPAFREETWGNPHFDPELYVVAVDEASDEYVGIARIWLRTAGAHLGFIGVARAHRRRGIASALLGRVFGVLAARGIAEVTTEIDVENVASRRTIEPLGARVVGTTIEVVRHRIG